MIAVMRRRAEISSKPKRIVKQVSAMKMPKTYLKHMDHRSREPEGGWKCVQTVR